MLAELAVGTSVTVSVYLILKQYPHYIVHCTRFVCAFPTYWIVLSYTKLRAPQLKHRKICPPAFIGKFDSGLRNKLDFI